MSEQEKSRVELLRTVLDNCRNYGQQLLGESKCRNMLQASYQVVLPYFPYLEQLKISDSFEIGATEAQISEKEILAFSAWMQHFISSLKSFMVGLGRLDITDLTGELHDPLETIGFYEFYRQARELQY